MIDSNNFLILLKTYHDDSTVALETNMKSKRDFIKLSFYSTNVLGNCPRPWKYSDNETKNFALVESIFWLGSQTTHRKTNKQTKDQTG